MGILPSTPGDLQNQADAVDREIANIDNAIDGHTEVPQASWDGFQVFLSQWKKFYSSNFKSSFDTWMAAVGDDDIQAQLDNFTAQAEVWGKQMQQFVGTIPGGLVAPPAPTDLKSLLPDLKGLGITFDVAIIAAVILFVVWRVLK